MEHLDDFIREQFRHDDPAARFPFQEEYWEQALPLIEAAERKRRRRRGLFWWWFAGGLLLTGGWWLAQSSVAADRLVVQPQVQPTAPGRPRPAPDALPAPQTGFVPSPGQPVAEYGNMAPEASHHPENSASERQKRENSRTAQAVNRPPSAREKISSPHPYTTAETARNGVRQNTSSPANRPSADEPSTVAFAANAPLPAPAGSGPVDAAFVPDLAAGADSAAGWPVKARSPFGLLPTAFQPLTYTAGGFTLARVPFNFPVIRPVREPVFAVGVHSSAVFYPAAPAGDAWGAAAGVYGEYWVRPAWSVSAGVAWRTQSAPRDSVELSAASYQLHYRFGYEETAYRREDRTLHFFEIPLGLHWHRRAWQVEVGATFGRLAAVRSVEIQTSRSSLFPAPEEVETRVRGQKDAYRRTYTGFFAGMGWQPWRRVGLQVRYTYRPAALLSPVAEGAPSGGHGWLQAGLQWQLFSDERIRLK